MYAEKYQWTKGDKAGKVEQYTSHDNEWVYFVGGSRINAQLIQEYMMQVDANTPLDLDFGIPSKPAQSVETQQTVVPVVAKEEFNPVKSLLKQAAKDNLKCTYNFEISIPRTMVYKLIKDSFDTDVDSLILDLAMADIKPVDLFKQVEQQVKEQLLKFYNNGNNSSTGKSNTGESRSKEKSSAMDEQTSA